MLIYSIFTKLFIAIYLYVTSTLPLYKLYITSTEMYISLPLWYD